MPVIIERGETERRRDASLQAEPFFLSRLDPVALASRCARCLGFHNNRARFILHVCQKLRRLFALLSIPASGVSRGRRLERRLIVRLLLRRLLLLRLLLLLLRRVLERRLIVRLLLRLLLRRHLLLLLLLRRVLER